MKIVNIIGGLGNQMFQYAFAIALKAYYPNEDIYIDTSHFHTIFFKRYRGHNLHYGYELEKIIDNIAIPTANWTKLIKVTNYMPNYILSRFIRKFLPKRKSEFLEKVDFTYDKEVLKQEGDRYFEGYWQVANYYIDNEKAIKEVFKFKPLDVENMKLASKIMACNSVSIHVRRGDYINNKGFGGICTLDYYRRAIDFVLSRVDVPFFFVFSNEVRWCEDNLKPIMKGADFLIVNHNKGRDSYKDMQLMSYCHINIIANSSFSWWGAFLNKNSDAMVISPSKWNNRFEKVDIYPDSWIKI